MAEQLDKNPKENPSSSLIVRIITIAYSMVFVLFGVFAISSVINMFTNSLVSIQWYYYVGVMAIAAISVYLFAWWVVRNLKYEDWNNDVAKNIVFIVVFTITLIMCFGSLLKYPAVH
jgi:hypothetical protein